MIGKRERERYGVKKGDRKTDFNHNSVFQHRNLIYVQVENISAFTDIRFGFKCVPVVWNRSKNGAQFNELMSNGVLHILWPKY